jgi:hypothetical protein
MVQLKDEMSGKVRETIGQMETTSSIFAPVMIGASVGIFKIMEQSTGDLSGGELIGASIGGDGIPSWAFIVISGVYLLLLSISTTITFHRVENGMPRGGWEKVPKRVLQSSLAFTGGILLSVFLLGG